MLKCSCGKDHSAADHHAAVAADAAAVELRKRSLTSEFEAYSNEFIEATLVKALFPQDERAPPLPARRRQGHGAWPPSPSVLPVGTHAGHGPGTKASSKKTRT